MTLIVFLVVGILVIVGAALVFTGRWSAGMTGTDRPPAPPHPATGAWTAQSLRQTKFRVALRGYRMQDVDAALASLAQQLADTRGESNPADPVSGSPTATPTEAREAVKPESALADVPGSESVAQSTAPPSPVGPQDAEVEPPYGPPAR